MAFGHVQSPEILDGMISVSAKLLERNAFETLMQAIPAGFIIASVAWIRSAENQTAFWIVLVLTLAISLCGFAHVVAGAAEAFLLLWTGAANVHRVFFGFILPALIGNIIGGTLLVACLAHAQVSQEIRAALALGSSNGHSAEAAPSLDATSPLAPLRGCRGKGSSASYFAV